MFSVYDSFDIGSCHRLLAKFNVVSGCCYSIALQKNRFISGPLRSNESHISLKHGTSWPINFDTASKKIRSPSLRSSEGYRLQDVVAYRKKNAFQVYLTD